MADFEVKFASEESNQKVQFGEVQTVNTGSEPYKGDYAVTPKVDKQIMPTKGKVLIDDVTINAIPFFDVSNNSGGSTVYIAKEI